MKFGKNFGFGRRIYVRNQHNFTFVGFFLDLDKTAKGTGFLTDNNEDAVKYSGYYEANTYYLLQNPTPYQFTKFSTQYTPQ